MFILLCIQIIFLFIQIKKKPNIKKKFNGYQSNYENMIYMLTYKNTTLNIKKVYFWDSLYHLQEYIQN